MEAGSDRPRGSCPLQPLREGRGRKALAFLPVVVWWWLLGLGCLGGEGEDPRINSEESAVRRGLVELEEKFAIWPWSKVSFASLP